MTPRPLTAAELADLRELLEKATPGPWWKRTGGTDIILADHPDGIYVGNCRAIADSRAVVSLRNHAEALLDAAEENARLKAGVSDRDHTTHFDDCGCRSARYEADIARLKAKLAAVEPVARAAVAQRYCCGYHVELDCVRKKLHPAVDALPPDVLAELWKEE